MSIKFILRKILLFRKLSDSDLNKITSIGKFKKYRQDETIFSENASGNALYIVLSGIVKIFAQTGVKRKTLAYLKPGEFFGEMSVLDGRPRVAQVISETPTRCLALASWDLEAVIRQEPAVAISILRALAARLRDVTETARH